MCFSDTGDATLRIIGAASEDDGVYTCTATNELGSVTSSASLRVLGKCIRRSQPAPTAKPQTCCVIKYAFFSFFFSAVSTGGLRVSWKDNLDSQYTEVAELGR